ncbi:MAG: domain containing CoxE-like protein, partial [Planctomycetaceae bacterium]|nr:domain containing CoxE-like protein [Planctomycetaceae bacterium]
MKVFKMPGWRLSLALVGSGFLIAAASAAEPVKSTSPTATPGLVQFQTPEGVSYAAVVLPAPAAPSIAAVPHDHVVLIDTSASQSGDFRSRSIAMVGAVCRALPAGDRVRLIAADVTASSLTNGFVLVGSRQLQAGFDKLEERVPLGSTNMEVALRTALQSFSGTRARSVLYVGDGYSTAQLIQSSVMAKLLADMRTATVTVNSFAIGPRIDLILLGTLAQHTGGVVVIDEPTLVADNSDQPAELSATAREITRALVAPVFYPERMVTSPKIATYYPKSLPPIRFDRETVLLGKDLTTSKLQVKLAGTLNGQSKEYSWSITSEAVAGSTGFVGQAWALAEGSQGLAMPWAGRKLMNQAQLAFDGHLNVLAQAGVRSLNAKNLKQVEAIAKTLQELDPNNLDAPALLTASRRLQAKPVKRQLVLAQAEEQEAQPEPEEKAAPEEKPAAEEKPAEEKPAAEKTEPEEKPAAEKKPEATEAPADEKPEGEAKPVPAAPEPGAEERPAKSAVDQSTGTEDKSNPKSGSLLEDLEARRKVREEQITIDVNVAIQDAQAGARDSFPDAYDILKRQLDTVVAATDISADVRQALRKRVETSIQQLQNESETFEQKRAALDRQLSQQEAMKKLMDQTQRDEEKMEQLIDRVRALLIRGFKGNPQAFEDAEAVSRVAVELDPYLGVPNLDVFNSEAAGHLDKARRLRSERQDKLLALLYQVELSH